MADVTALLAAAVVAPAVAAVLLTVAGRRGTERSQATLDAAVPVVGAVVAAWWAVLATPTDTPTWGGLEVSPLVAVALAGVALVVAASSPTGVVARSTALTALTVVAVGATSGGIEFPDRTLAAGVVGGALLLAVAARSDGEAWTTPVTTVVAGVLGAVAVVVDQPDVGAMVSLAGVTVLVLGALRPTAESLPVTSALLPVASLVVVLVMRKISPAGDAERVAAVGAVLGALATVGLAIARNRPSPAHLPIAAVVAGVVVSVQDLPDTRGAGLLLIAGGVLALAARHQIGLVAAVPGLTASFAAFGAATHPAHAAAGGAAVALLALGVATAPRPGPLPHDAERRVLLLAAVAFAVLPAWGWSGVALDDHAEAIATAAAFGLPVAVGLQLLPGGSAGVAGRLARRRDDGSTPSPATPPHGSTILEVDGEVPRREGRLRARLDEEARAPEGQQEEVEPDEVEPQEDQREEAQPGVAVSPGPVPVRARLRGAPLRGRVRARTGRTS